MKIEIGKISKIVESDVEIIQQFIKDFFPYTNLNFQKISDKINNPNFFIIKYYQKNILVGFAELQFFGNDLARMNAVFVEEAWRGQKIGTKLMKALVHECKRKRIHKIFLLVKEENVAAKALYKKRKFVFEKMHDKIIDGSKVEEWVRIIH